MTSFFLIFAAALIFAIGATPVAQRVAVRLGVLDHPAARKAHLQPVPLMGGAAIYLAIIAAMVVFSDRFQLPQLVGIFLGATLVSFLGVWDDRWGLRPVLKLLGQGLAAGILVISGVHVAIFPHPALDYGVTILWVVGITNSLNLLDNMDGLSGGVAAVAAAFFLLLAALSGQYLVGSLAAALLGACIGFLRYNFNPASIFMGDTGALFLGFVLAALGIKLRFEQVTVVTWMIPLLVLGIPIFDTTLVVVSRLLRRLNPLTNPGRDHLSHRLVVLGMTPREAVLTIYLTGGALGMVAIFLTRATLIEAYVAGGLVALIAVAALIRLEKVNYERQRQQKRS